MRPLAATRALACGALFAGLPQCADPEYVSLGGNFALPILAADAAAPPPSLFTDDGEPACPVPRIEGAGTCAEPPPTAAPDDGGCEPGAAAVALAANCAERREVSCSVPMDGNPAPTDRERLDATLDRLLDGCLEQINVLKVQFEGGCATRFELTMPNASALACVSSRLESERYVCAAGASCGSGTVFRVPTI